MKTNLKTSLKIAFASILGLATGASAGFFFQTADTTEDSAKGDIAKVSKFSKNVVSPAMSAFQEKITSNPEELEKATTSLTILTSRMTEFDELVNIATSASEGNEELAASLKNLQSVSQLASNARTNGNQALEALSAIAEGKKSSVNYEQASQNLALAFMMVDRQINVGKQYVCDVDAFLRGKDVEDYKELALARDLWAGYCAGEAMLTNDSEDLAYWSKQQSLISSSEDVLADVLHLEKFVPEVLKQCIELDANLGIGSINTPIMKTEVISNSDVQRMASELQGTDMIKLSEGFNTVLDVNQMMQNILPFPPITTIFTVVE